VGVSRGAIIYGDRELQSAAGGPIEEGGFRVVGNLKE